MAIRLIALDFGSTTSKALEASAQLSRNLVTGRTELREIRMLSRSEPVFTPFAGDRLDEEKIHALVSTWLAPSAEARAQGETIAGGVIITGLAAKKENAKTVASAVRLRLGDAVVAVADDPGKESWLAFMGSCAALSGAYPKERFLNFDIGGGTTNLALGANKNVRSTGSLWVGARHLYFEPGTYCLAGLSPFGRRLLTRLKIARVPGATLGPDEIARIIGFYVACLEAAVRPGTRREPGPRFLEQLRFPPVPPGPAPICTFSGGVGELVYRLIGGENLPLTPYGDLGADLAHGILRSPLLSRHLREIVPLHLGRATVCGLAFHGVEASGATVFLPRPEILPLRDLPLLGRITERTSQSELERMIARARCFPGGTCLQAAVGHLSLEGLKCLAGKVASALRKNRFPKGIPLIIFLPQNIGKTFGLYATEWGRLQADLVVIDEIAGDAIERKAFFASVHRSGSKGGPEQNLLVSFYGGMDQP